jgi:predicted GIY-YIG superfamily endonuclease
MSIYLLKLEQGKYYVGRSENPKRRYEEHINGQCGSRWTEIYKPIKMKILKQQANNFDEDRYTKEIMMKHGIDNVRGGTYCMFHLPKPIKDMIYKEIKNATDRCFNCGAVGHYVADCTKKKKDLYTQPKIAQKPLRTNKCSCCHKSGHNIRSCPLAKY